MLSNKNPLLGQNSAPFFPASKYTWLYRYLCPSPAWAASKPPRLLCPLEQKAWRPSLSQPSFSWRGHALLPFTQKRLFPITPCLRYFMEIGRRKPDLCSPWGSCCSPFCFSEVSFSRSDMTFSSKTGPARVHLCSCPTFLQSPSGTVAGNDLCRELSQPLF